MADEGDSKSLVLITRVGSTPTTGIRSSLESNDSGLLFFFQKTLHRIRLDPLYCHEGDWSWIYFFNGQCADAAGTALLAVAGAAAALNIFLSKSIEQLPMRMIESQMILRDDARKGLFKAIFWTAHRG